MPLTKEDRSTLTQPRQKLSFIKKHFVVLPFRGVRRLLIRTQPPHVFFLKKTSHVSKLEEIDTGACHNIGSSHFGVPRSKFYHASNVQTPTIHTTMPCTWTPKVCKTMAEHHYKWPKRLLFHILLFQVPISWSHILNIWLSLPLHIYIYIHTEVLVHAREVQVHPTVVPKSPIQQRPHRPKKEQAPASEVPCRFGFRGFLMGPW